jgi:hypothetical protein
MVSAGVSVYKVGMSASGDKAKYHVPKQSKT